VRLLQPNTNFFSILKFVGQTMKLIGMGGQQGDKLFVKNKHASLSHQGINNRSKKFLLTRSINFKP